MSQATNKSTTSCSFLVAAMYCFARLDDPALLRQKALERASSLQVIGTLIVAEEGINGTLAGEPQQLRDFLDWLVVDMRFSGISLKVSETNVLPFGKLKVKRKREIVTMGTPNLLEHQSTGAYVEPREWNTLIESPGTVVIDTRNHFEVELGRFENAVDPNTRKFSEFPQWSKQSEHLKNAQAIAMYCTGGIRCEKASAYLRSQGHANVYQLKGGILQYLKDVLPEKSKWKGKCFVFDQRKAVDATDA